MVGDAGLVLDAEDDGALAAGVTRLLQDHTFHRDLQQRGFARAEEFSWPKPADRILDAAIELRSDSDSMIEVQLRRFGSFRRYQRNRFIEALANLGCTDKEIRGRVKRELGEDLSLSHIYRLAAPRRVRA